MKIHIYVRNIPTDSNVHMMLDEDVPDDCDVSPFCDSLSVIMGNCPPEEWQHKKVINILQTSEDTKETTLYFYGFE